MGTLYIVATPIGNLGDMTPRAIEVLRSVSLIAAEDTRHSGKLLAAFGIDTPMLSYHHHNRSSRESRLLSALREGDVALISDAGTPAIADPGHELVVAAMTAGFPVVPVPGASSLVAAVSVSGLVAGPFTFVGFLPRAGEERRAVLGRAVASAWPFVLFESPLRVAGTLQDVAGLDPSRTVLVARELTKLHEELVRGSVSDLALRFKEGPPRGEVVIVVGASEGPSDDAELDVESLAASILDQGVKPSKAARELSEMTDMESAEAYALIQRLQRERRSS